MANLAGRRAGQLSVGEAQWVSRVRAMVLEPQLLLLDEPYSALDPPTRGRLLDDLGALWKNTATTTVFAAHDLFYSDQLATRMAIILENRLRQVESPKKKFSKVLMMLMWLNFRDTSRR